MDAGHKRKRLVALILGVALIVVLFLAFVAPGNAGDPSIPDGDVALVEDAPDGGVSDEEFQQNLLQAAFNLQLREVPPTDDPQYDQVKEAAISNAIQGRWVRGEAADRGIEVTDRDVDKAFDQIVQEQLGGEKGYKEFLASSKVDGEPAFDEDAVREVAELTAISDRLQSEALPSATPDVPDEDVDDYYNANIEQFEQPETRDVRIILNPDAGKIQDALDALGTDPSPDTWDKVAKKYSTDEATKSQGGLREAVAERQNEPALDDAIFSAETGEVVGPIEGESGSYVIQVEQVTPAETTPLSDVKDQIVSTLQQGLEAQAVEQFRSDFIGKWTSRTFCDDDVVVDLCSNAEPPPEPCTIDDEKEREQADPAALKVGCPAPALPRNVVSPGTAGVFPGTQVPALPQGPVKPASAQPALPPGAAPIGPGGAPPVPPSGSSGTPPPATP